MRRRVPERCWIVLRTLIFGMRFRSARARSVGVILGLAVVGHEPAQAEILWGANGHPLASYPGVSLEKQLDLVRGFGGRSYRVDIGTITKLEGLKTLVALGRQRGVSILPVLTPPLDLKTLPPEELYKKSFAFAEYLASRVPEVEVWELGNELENFAIIQPCEMRDDGTQYPCNWGPAGGVGASDYYGPRYAKVAALIRGLSDGIKKANPKARRAVGSAGWGHTGIFERFAKDGIAWDITVWHMYKTGGEWAFKILAQHGKPIWVTEFNDPDGASPDKHDVQAKGLVALMAELQKYETPYKVEAAFIYELLDELYWAPNFEAYQGIVTLVKNGSGGWQLGPIKPSYTAAKAFIEQTSPTKAAKSSDKP
jgi:hypothetical protein